ncbi:hypothetical protein SAMN04488045_0044 [Thalassococcus halodurans]|uniref:Uncharacterized protein n=1 Tax=Thalassococcus halodurans TaxID=373675 RepID=A0A1H5RZ97_9RHOB|nr:hypothetical protein [Thalassococcus halodurans]SEF43645.1 hypothetical protein SAMN04488045_0044 [Thalassococcus halodurans]
MSVVTVRAHDTVEAMEMVAQKLGPDALILSCKSKNGMIEIVASDSPIDVANVPSKPVEKPAEIAEVTAPPAPEATSGVVDIEIAENAPRRASFADQFKSQAMATPSKGMLDIDMVLNAPRVVLVGPAGAGKSLVATQLAAAMLDVSEARSLRFGYCGSGSHSDAAYLAQKAKLLGIDLTFADPRNFSGVRRGHTDIVVVSGKGAEGPLQAAALGVPMGARTVLVLPAGLRADRISYEIKRWAAPDMGVIFTCEPAFPPDGKDFEAVAQAGVTRLWTSFNDRILAGLITATEAPASKAAMPVSDIQGENT